MVLVEGESDSWTLWYAGVAALGIPGAGTWKEVWKTYVQGFDEVYVWRESDKGGDTLAAAVAADLPDARIIEAPSDAKDPNELWFGCGRDPGAFRVRMEQLMAAARPASQLRTEALGAEARQLFDQCRHLLNDPNLLALIGDAIREAGYAGDLNPPLLVYISLISRFLERPLNLAIIAQSAAGKNRAVDAALELMPPEAYHLEKAGSARALIYSDADFAHRVVIVAEADSIPTEGPAASAIRSLAADSSMSYDVVEKDATTGQFRTRRVEKPGPTGLITTSTRPLDEQMSTRVLTVAVADTPAQTRAVLLAHAASVNGAGPALDAAPLIALQRWLEIAGDHQVTVPFAYALAHAVPDRLVRMRRDFRQLLTVIQAVALLHQCQRQRDERGRIVAELLDYQLARELLLETFTAAASGGLSKQTRETVTGLSELYDGTNAVTISALGERMGVAKDTAWHRVRRAISLGLIVNTEARKGHPAKLVTGDPLPEDRPALPTVGQLLASMCVDQAEADSTVQPLDDEQTCAQSEEPVESTVEAAIQPHFQPPLSLTADSEEAATEDTVERLNGNRREEHTDDQLDEADRVYTLALAETLDYPRLQVRLGETVVGGKDAWENFLERANHDRVVEAMNALEREPR